MVGTFPQLEYPRGWPAGVHVVGPLIWEPPFGEVQAPPGAAPLVLVAPSTAQDPSHRLLRAALSGLRGEPVRVLATWNRRPLGESVAVPANTRLVEWVSYAKTMPACSLVICHAGHGTMARALACGCPVLAVPHVGDMAENAARADWAGVGVRLPWRLLGPASLRLAVRRALGERTLSARARELAGWAAANDGAARAADLVEGLARGSDAGQSAVVIRASAHELDQFRCIALDEVHRLARAAAQLDDRADVGDLERTPDRAVKLPVFELGDRQPRPHVRQAVSYRALGT